MQNKFDFYPSKKNTYAENLETFTIEKLKLAVHLQKVTHLDLRNLFLSIHEFLKLIIFLNDTPHITSLSLSFSNGNAIAEKIPHLEYITYLDMKNCGLKDSALLH